MDSIKLMIDEHKNIKRMLVVIRSACLKLMKEDKIDFEDFTKMISFVRNYADAHHHGKEEKMLFTKMVTEIGPTAEVVVKHGMLVEHDQGRFFIKELEQALIKVKNGEEEAKLDIIANAIGYTNLLTRHIDKEDKVVYTFAQRELSKETLELLDSECESFEKKEEGIVSAYTGLLKELEEKYL